MNKIGLYLHVPFCRQKCRYCDFYSLADHAGMDAYMAKLLSFLPRLWALCRDRTVDSIYLGGGTPSLLPPAALTKLFRALREGFQWGAGIEVTAEANPESLTEPVLSALREGGVNRLSLGMQSNHDGELHLLGRIHTAADTVRAVEKARSMGFDNLNLDLMYGLPGQTKERFLSNLDAALSLRPRHLSFYSLTLSEEVPLYARRHEIPGDEEQWETYAATSARLEREGMEHYEISNAAQPGFASRHNLRYWNREEYLGLGPGAWSYFNGERFAMIPSLDRFLAAETPEGLISERETVTARDAAEEEIMLSLRLARGLEEDRLLAVAGAEKKAEVFEKLEKMVPAGLAEKTPRGYRLTLRGFFVSNEILSQLI